MTTTQDTYYLSKDAIAELKKELEHLTSVKRKEIAGRLAKARDYGDISENSEFEAAMEEQSMIEGRIAEIQEILRKSVVRDKPRKKGGKVEVGSEVTVKVGDLERECTIVSMATGDPTKGEISQNSPLGQALVGKTKGDSVTIQAPAGEIAYEIIEVR